MIASAELLLDLQPLEPFIEEKTLAYGMSFGLSYAGYDVRVDQDIVLDPQGFSLASTMERFRVPAKFLFEGRERGLLGVVHDKSSWARQGLSVQNTVIEPGWEGYLTLELTNHGHKVIRIEKGMPIAQIIFHLTTSPGKGYDGKYQGQGRGAVPAILEGATK